MTASSLRIRSGSPASTRALGAVVADVVTAGDVVLLGGDLGAGKTAFTQGLASALGVVGPVTSPTFTLMRTYPTARRFQLLHADVYRLEHLQEVIDLGISELLEDQMVAVVEWGERAAPALRPEVLDIHIQFGFPPGAGGEDDRTVDLRFVGPAWLSRLAGLSAALERSPLEVVG